MYAVAFSSLIYRLRPPRFLTSSSVGNTIWWRSRMRTRTDNTDDDDDDDTEEDAMMVIISCWGKKLKTRLPPNTYGDDDEWYNQSNRNDELYRLELALHTIPTWQSILTMTRDGTIRWEI
jgi:hypothetical protein